MSARITRRNLLEMAATGGAAFAVAATAAMPGLAQDAAPRGDRQIDYDVLDLGELLSNPGLPCREQSSPTKPTANSPPRETMPF